VPLAGRPRHEIGVLGGLGHCAAQGTVVEETIAHAAGAVTPTEEKVASLVRVIREAGRVPVQRDSFYNVVRRFD